MSSATTPVTSPGPGGTPTVVASIPSLSRSVDELQRLTGALTALGMTPVVVATGRRLDEELAGTGIRHVSPRRNGGFGFAVRAGAQAVPDWDWLAIVNDDITIDVARCAPQVDSVLALGADQPVLAYLDPTPPKVVPTVGTALATLSLATAVQARSRRAREARAGAESPGERGRFRPFSFVLISRALWDRIDGLDPRFPYTYEDADFARRAEAAGARIVFATGDGVSHGVHGTSGRHLATVLPVSAWSTQAYLDKLTDGAWWVTPACVGALVLRAPLALASSADRKAHLRGIGRSIRALATRQEPHLPDYADC